MIEELGKFLALLLGLIKKGEYQKSSELLENIYYDLLKEDAAFFRNIPEEDLAQGLLEKHNYTNGHLEILAELFNAEAELCFAQNDKPNTLSYSRKSLRLFRFIDTGLKTYSKERIDKMQEIEERLKNLEKI